MRSPLMALGPVMALAGCGQQDRALGKALDPVTLVGSVDSPYRLGACVALVAGTVALAHLVLGHGR